MAEATQTEHTTATPRTHGWCHWHKGLGGDPRVIQVVESASGSGASLSACSSCRARRGLVPLADRP